MARLVITTHDAPWQNEDALQFGLDIVDITWIQQDQAEWTQAYTRVVERGHLAVLEFPGLIAIFSIPSTN
jgi:hypothetical protein